MQAHAAQARRWPFWFLAAALTGLIIGFLPAALGYPTVYTADPQLYAEAMDRMFGGEIPYLDFDFEHLPLAIAPMSLAYIIASITGLPFAYPFMIIQLAMVFATGVLVVRIGEDLGFGDVGLRWVAMVAPMLVIVPHRVDALSVMLAVAAIFFAVGRNEGTSFSAAIGAVVSKGWPVVLAAADWWRGRRQRAFGLVGITVAMGVLLLALPGFRAGRSFVGVHEETLSGTIVIVWRLLVGTNPGIVDSAGAVYVGTGTWALALNLAVGSAIGVAALTVLRRSFSWQGGVAVTGALTYAVLLASPLLSTQFLLWPVPFVALAGSRQARWLLTTAAVLSVALTGIWFPGKLWWHTGWLIRNAVLVAAAIYSVRDAHRVAKSYEASTSRRNLPV